MPVEAWSLAPRGRMAMFAGEPIGRHADQPFEGHYWTMDRASRRIRHRWRAIAPR